MIPITSLYIALCALMLVALSALVIRQRYRSQIAIGTEAPSLARAARAQGNFTEYAPMILLLMAAAELAHAPAYLLHTSGFLLLASRTSHAYSLLAHEPQHNTFHFRMAGMITTFALLVALSLYLLFKLL